MSHPVPLSTAFTPKQTSPRHMSEPCERQVGDETKHEMGIMESIKNLRFICYPKKWNVNTEVKCWWPQSSEDNRVWALMLGKL